MNEEKLKELGLEEAQVNSVMKLHKDSIDGNYVTKTRFNEVNSEVKQLKDDVENRDDQLEELKKIDPEKLQEEITTLQTTNKEQAENYESEMKQLKINHALENQLKDAGAKNSKTVAALLDLKDAELDDSGLIKGLEEQVSKIKESDEYLFDIKEPPKNPEFKGAQPGSQKQNEPGGKPDPTKMSYSEFEAYLTSQNN